MIRFGAVGEADLRAGKSATSFRRILPRSANARGKRETRKSSYPGAAKVVFHSQTHASSAETRVPPSLLSTQENEPAIGDLRGAGPPCPSPGSRAAHSSNGREPGFSRWERTPATWPTTSTRTNGRFRIGDARFTLPEARFQTLKRPPASEQQRARPSGEYATTSKSSPVLNVLIFFPVAAFQTIISLFCGYPVKCLPSVERTTSASPRRWISLPLACHRSFPVHSRVPGRPIGCLFCWQVFP